MVAAADVLHKGGSASISLWSDDGGNDPGPALTSVASLAFFFLKKQRLQQYKAPAHNY